MNLDEDLHAALIGDLDALATSATVPASAFRSALQMRFPPRAEEGDLHPLLILTKGLAAEYDGDSEAASAAYGSLAETREPATAVLGNTMLAWMGSGDTQALRIALDGSALLNDEARAACARRLLTIALDIGDAQGAELCYTAAVTAEKHPYLKRQLQILANSTLSIPTQIENRQFAASTNSEQRIVEALSGVAAHVVESTFIASIRSPWRRTWSFGGDRDLLALSSAELTAAWIGAPWLLPQIRRQTAALLLGGRASTTADYEQGLAYWALGNGQDAAEIGAAYEAKLDIGSTSRILDNHLRGGRRFDSHVGYVALCRGLWDIVPREDATQLLPLIRPSLQHSQPDDAATFWSLASLVVGSPWSQPFLALEEDQQAAVVAAMSAFVVERVPVEAFRTVLEIAVRAVQESHPDAALLFAEPLVAAWQRQYPRKRLDDDLVQRLPDHVLLAQELQVAALIGEDNLRVRVDSLVGRCRKYQAEGRGGSQQMFIVSPFLLLGSLATGLSYPSSTVAALLTETLLDPLMPLSYRLSACSGLIALTRRHDLDQAQRDQLAGELPRSRPIFTEVEPPELLEARLERLLVILPGAAPSPRALILARHPDAAVRLEVVASLDASRRAGPLNESDAMCLASSLFDPDSRVLQSAISVSGAWAATLAPALRLVILDRIQNAYVSGGSRLREHAVDAAIAARANGVSDGGLDKLLAAAQRDRSWIVRHRVRASAETPRGQ